jgi:2,3-bisphosphoglycerate-dependent phosphoglycerate mutase
MEHHGNLQIWFVRHGESEANVSRIYANTGDGYPLTSNGYEQARSFAESLSGTRILGIYSSPLLRARQTAQMVGKATGASIQIAPELIEYHVGIYEGTSTLPGSAGAIADREIKKRWYLHQDFDASLPGGESLNQMRARFMPFVNTALDRYNRESGIVLMISHGGLMVAMLPLVFENIDFAFTQSHPIDHLRPIKGEMRERRFWCVEFDGEIPPGAPSLRSCLPKADGA